MKNSPVYGISLGSNGVSFCGNFRSPFLSLWYDAEDGFPNQFYATSKFLTNCDLQEANRRIATLMFLLNGARRVLEGGKYFYPAGIEFLSEQQGSCHADGLSKEIFKNNYFPSIAALRTIKDGYIGIKEIFELSFYDQFIADVILLYGTCVSYCVDDLQTAILKWSNLYKIYDNIKYALSLHKIDIVDIVDEKALESFTYSCNNSGVNWMTGRHGNDGKGLSKKINPMNLEKAMEFMDVMVKNFLIVYKAKLKENLSKTIKKEMISVVGCVLAKAAQIKDLREQFSRDVVAH